MRDRVEGSEATWREFGILLVVALVVRAVILPWLGDLPLAGDESYYWRYLSFLQVGDIDGLVLRPPLWSYLVATTRWIHDDPIAARALGAMVGACAPPLVYLLGARVFDRRTGLTAGVVLALYPEHVAFSHYLWAECLFATLLLLTVHLFFLFHEKRSTRFLLGASFLAGITLLSKALAAVVFGAFVLQLLFESVNGKLARIAGACLLFLLPVTVYSVVVSRIAGRTVVLCETGVPSMRWAVGLDQPGQFELGPETRDEQRAELMAYLRARPLSTALQDARTQLNNLWTPNSFVCKRLLGRPSGMWHYGLPLSWSLVLAMLVAISKILITNVGLAGLILGDTSSPFRTFALSALAGLCCTAAFVFLTSRHCLPFTFLLLLPAAALVADPKAHFARLRDPWRAIPLLLVLAMYASVVLVKRGSIGSWG